LCLSPPYTVQIALSQDVGPETTANVVSARPKRQKWVVRAHPPLKEQVRKYKRQASICNQRTNRHDQCMRKRGILNVGRQFDCLKRKKKHRIDTRIVFISIERGIPKTRTKKMRRNTITGVVREWRRRLPCS